MENDILDATRDYSEECDNNDLRNEIANVLRTYFETNDNGEPNERFDPNYSAQQALDEIHEIIGNI